MIKIMNQKKLREHNKQSSKLNNGKSADTARELYLHMAATHTRITHEMHILLILIKNIPQGELY